jgi:asparagine synthase (glutamine-hydrolysing)
MCGIAGQFLLDRRAQPADIRAMCDVIRHRGPDDEGFHIDGNCGLGMRRLSIIDLNTGHQPISNEDGSVWVVFNGEIYNYQDLRRDLIAQGHRFKTNSDTETLVHLYEQEGVDGIRKLRGMFAYAIWDARQRSVLLVRDRFGKKPLYYSHSNAGIYFGSELKCLRAAGVSLNIDQEALRHYFQFTYIPDPWSPFKEVKKLAPGSWLRFDASGKAESGRYWEVPAAADDAEPGLSEAGATQELRRLFDESVKIRLISDVPLGAFLSGGIDSSSVVASMALETGQPVKTFSIGFEESEFNELPFARLVAEKYKTDHHELIVRPDSVELVNKLIQHFDEPFGDSSAIPTYLVSEFAARHVKVVLTGDGGDELFAGYDSFRSIERSRVWDGVPLALRGAMSSLADALPYSAYGKNYLRMISRSSPLERYLDANLVPYYLRKQLLKPGWMAPADLAYFRTKFSSFLLANGASTMTQALYFEATAKLAGDMLVKVDRMSMANSLEVRCPMLDHQLAEFASRIPHGWKLRNGRGKDIFINAVGDRLPPGLLNRPKQGFGVPIAHWFRTSFRDFLRDHLLSAEFLNRDIVSREFLRHLIEEHESGRRNNCHYLWMLLMLDLWFREFEGSPCHAAPPVPAGTGVATPAF